MDKKGATLIACLITQIVPLFYWFVFIEKDMPHTGQENLTPEFVKLLTLMLITLVVTFIVIKFILSFRAIRKKIGVE